MWMRVAVALAIALQVQDTVSAEPPKVRPITGGLFLQKASANKAEAVAGETAILPSDRLGTAAGQLASFATEGDTIIHLRGVKLDGDNGLAIERTKGGLRLRLMQGRLVLESTATEFEIETGAGAVKGRGATVLVDVTEQKTRVVALDGGVTFTSAVGSTSVGPGQELVAEKGKKPGDPKPADVERERRELAGAQEPANLVRNGGFEDGVKPWYGGKLGAKDGTAIDKTVRCSGTASLKATLRTGDSRFGAALYDLEVVPGRRYFFRAYVKTKTRSGAIDPYFSLEEVMDGIGGSKVKQVLQARAPSPEGAWRLARGFVVPAEKVLRIDILIKPDGDSSAGTVWIDDVFVAEVPEAAKR